MLNKIKNLPLITKILYVITLLLFILWVLPTINAYFSKMSQHDKSIQELQKVSTKYGMAMNTQTFNKEVFQSHAKPLFSKVTVDELSNQTYHIQISMKPESLETFHTFIETLTLKYYVQIENGLSFTSKDESLDVDFKLKAL